MSGTPHARRRRPTAATTCPTALEMRRERSRLCGDYGFRRIGVPATLTHSAQGQTLLTFGRGDLIRNSQLFEGPSGIDSDGAFILNHRK